MSDYTVELHKIWDTYPALTRVMNEYPIHRSEHRPVLNNLIRDTYYFSDIGFETPEMFIHQLGARMRLIMPAYNQLYKTLDMEFDPLIDVDMVNTSIASQHTESDTHDSGTNTTSSNNTAVNDTFAYPQSQIGSGQHLTSRGASRGDSETTSDQATSSASELRGSNDTLGSTRGRGRSGAQLIMEYRSAIVNIDADIVSDLSDLFMGIWK